MIIKCFRCGREIDTPGPSNADYIMASDAVVKEQREALLARLHNQATREKKARGEKYDYSEYTYAEVSSLQEATDRFGVLGEASPQEGDPMTEPALRNVIVAMVERNVQKTAVICPGCYKDTDFTIWGVHKK